MQKAEFSIEGYKFDIVSIDMSNQISNEINLSFDVNGSFISKEKKYELIFSVSAFNDGKGLDNPFVFARCVGLFNFQNVKSIEEIPPFFYRNCTAILFPYLRAYISMLTNQANIPGLILPTYNVSSLGDELKKNTTLK